MDSAVNRFDPARQIAILWSIDDVQAIRRDLTDEQALHVLQKADKKMDAAVGINWDVLEYWADTLYPNPDYDEGDYEEG